MGFLRRNLGSCLRHVRLRAYQALGSCLRHVRLRAYQAFVLPILEYASAAWDPHLEGDIKSLEGVQRQAARFIGRSYERREGAVSSVLSDLKIIALSDRRKIRRLTVFYEFLAGRACITPPVALLPNRRPARSGNERKFINMQFRTDMGLQSFWGRTVGEWNKLPGSVANRETKGGGGFRQALHHHLTAAT